MTKNNDFEQKINDAACKAEEIASIVHCITEKGFIMTKEITKAYNKYDRNGTSTSWTLKAERKFEQVYKQVAELNKDLAFELDSIVGELSRAYEMQGFKAGYKAVVG